MFDTTVTPSGADALPDTVNLSDIDGTVVDMVAFRQQKAMMSSLTEGPVPPFTSVRNRPPVDYSFV